MHYLFCVYLPLNMVVRAFPYTTLNQLLFFTSISTTQNRITSILTTNISSSTLNVFNFWDLVCLILPLVHHNLFEWIINIWWSIETLSSNNNNWFEQINMIYHWMNLVCCVIMTFLLLHLCGQLNNFNVGINS